MSVPDVLSFDSLGYSLGVPGLVRDIYPWVSWLYRDHLQLGVLFVLTGLAFGLAGIWSGRMRYVGLSRKDRREYCDRYQRDNQRSASFSVVASLDSPGRVITARRHLWHWLNMLTEWGGIALLIVLALAVVVESWGESLLRPGYYTYAEMSLFHPDNHFGIAWCIGGLAAGIVLAKLLAFFLLEGLFATADQKVNAKLNQESRRSSQRTGEMTDVRHLHFGEAVPVNALADFSTEQARKQQVVFLGKKEDGQPVLVPRDTWRKTNVQILGLPGSGKSVMATNALIRCVRDFGDAVVYFDPKGDAWAPHVFRAHCPDFTLLDLRPGKPAQLNLFRNLDSYALKNLLIAGFNLSETGDVADHYRNNEQKAAKLIADQFPNGATIQQVLAAAYALPEAMKKEVKGLITKLENVADLSVLQTDTGIDVAGVLNSGGCLYVIGSMEDEAVIRVQKMLFARCAQIILARDEFTAWPHASIMLDEIKYLLSKYVLNALGTLRSRDCNLLLAHQSLGDFGLCGQDLPADFVKTTVLDNTPIRWFYKAASEESAQWAAAQTGEIQVDVERRKIQRETGNVEHISGDSYIQKEARYLFDVNTLQHLPDGFAVITGLGVAHLGFSSPLRVERQPITLQSFPVLAKPDPLADYRPKDDPKRPDDDDFAELY
ncbi:type IV secretory system conjugative DNA transfer family protein [Kluyvera intermedia]|uniref:type IV secretory system conjugative DNA transfer family protein n=1 Tax=Kluyvera intermedia TaxID=61648 RepID=UPI00352471AE